MKKLTSLALALIIFSQNVLAQTVEEKSKPTLAFMFYRNTQSSTGAEGLNPSIREGLLKRVFDMGAFVIVDRQTISEISNEMKIQFSGLNEGETNFDIYGANFLIATSYVNKHKGAKIQLRIIDTRTSEIRLQTDADFTNPHNFEKALDNLAKQIYNNFYTEGYERTVKNNFTDGMVVKPNTTKKFPAFMGGFVVGSLVVSSALVFIQLTD